MLQKATHHGGAAWPERLSGHSEDLIDADVLDAWFDPAPLVVSALHDQTAWTARTSPPADGAIALRAICETRGLDPSTVVLGAGSSDLLYRGLMRWISPNERVMIVDPGYSEYPHVLRNIIGSNVAEFRLEIESLFELDLHRLAHEARFCKWVVLVNPNNPIGDCLSQQALVDFMRTLRPGTWLWIDEAYLDYVPEAESLEKLVAGHNLVVLRSLSKTLALSGLRAAYLTAPATVAADLRSITPPWAMSLPAQLAVEAAMASPDYYAARYIETGRLRAKLAAHLSEIDEMVVFEGAANWVLAFLPADAPTAKTVCQSCAERGLYVRDASRTSQALGNRAIRIAVKDEKTNERIVETMRSVLAVSRL